MRQLGMRRARKASRGSSGWPEEKACEMRKGEFRGHVSGLRVELRMPSAAGCPRTASQMECSSILGGSCAATLMGQKRAVLVVL